MAVSVKTGEVADNSIFPLNVDAPVTPSVPPTVDAPANATLPLESSVAILVPFGYIIFFTPIVLVIFLSY